MANTNPFCVAPSHPLVREVAKKYNLSLKDARTIINNSRSEDAALQNDDISLEFLEKNDTFKKYLSTFVVEGENLITRNTFNEREERERTSDIFIKDLEELIQDKEEVARIIDQHNQIIRDKSLSVNSAKNIAKTFSSFKSLARMEFLGTYICKAIFENVTFVLNSPQIMAAYGIQPNATRRDVYTNPVAYEKMCKIVKIKLLNQAKELRAKGRDDLAVELEATIRNFKEMLYIYGSRMFRTDGIQVDINCTSSNGNANPSSNEMNDHDEDDPENDDYQSENPASAFSSSDQNKSVSSKIVPDIKVMLETLHEKDSNGNDIEDRFGFGLPQYVSSSYATNKLLKLCQGCKTYGQMVKCLERNKKASRWLGQLLDALNTDIATDSTGKAKVSSSKKEQLQSMFFKSFRKQFTHARTSYLDVNENGDTIVVNRDVNTNHRSERMVRATARAFSRHSGIGIITDGIVKFSTFVSLRNKYFKGSKGLSQRLNAVASKAIQVSRDISYGKATRDDYKTAVEELNKIKDDVVSVLKMYGLNVSDNLMNEYISNMNTDSSNESSLYGEYKKYGDEDLEIAYNKLKSLIDKLKKLNNGYIEWGAYYDKVGATIKSPFFSKRKDGDRAIRKTIENQYKKIADSLCEFAPDSVQDMYHINGKSYYSWNNPSSIGTIIEGLSNADRQQMKDYIIKKYGKDLVWYMKPGSTLKDPHFYSDWLESIFHGNGSNIIEYSEKPSFCGKEYNKMTDAEYAISILNDYFSEVAGDKNTTWYRMLIASDKPRYSSIRFTRHSDRTREDTEFGPVDSEKNYHTVITDKALDFFSQEMRRSIDVVSNAALKKRGTTFKNYDLKETESNKHVFEKLRNIKDKIDRKQPLKESDKITIDDVVVNGNYIFKDSGASFYMNKFIIDEIQKKTALGKYVIDRIFNAPFHAGEELVEKDMIRVFKDGFKNYMNNIRDAYMQKLDDMGVLDSQVIKSNEPDTPDSVHMLYFKGLLSQWHSDEENFSKWMYGRKKEAAAYAKKNMGIDLNDKKYEKFEKYFCELVTLRDDIEEFTYNNWLAKANMSQIFDVDLAFYANTTDFQKRNAQIISAGYISNPDAKIHGEVVSDGFFRSITLRTQKIPSDTLANIDQVLTAQADTIKDKNKYDRFMEGYRYTMDALKNYDPTDGQAFTGLTALRKRMAGYGEWSVSATKQTDIDGYLKDDKGEPIKDKNGNIQYVHTHEAVYNRIKRGYASETDKGAFVDDMMFTFAEVQKPFVYSLANMKRGDRTITYPVQHKNSEFALVFLTAFSASQKKPSQYSTLEAISRFLEDSAQDERHGIDSVNFDSAVKVGLTSGAIDLSDMSGEMVLKTLHEKVYGNNKPKNENYNKDIVTKYEQEDYKIVQEKPEHFKTGNQPLGAQLKILAISNIDDKAKIELNDGSVISGKELKARYLDLLARKSHEAQTRFKNEMGLRLPRDSRQHRLSNTLKSDMSVDQKFDAEMRESLSIVKREGREEFTIPLDDPSTQASVEAMLFSKIRKANYKQKTRGGIVVQATNWGDSDELHIRFYSANPADAKYGNGTPIVPTKKEFLDDNKGATEADYRQYLKDNQKGYAWFECEIPMPRHIENMLKGKDGKIQREYFNRDGSWNMEEIRKTVPEKMLDAICYRTPTEAKYSIMVCKVKRFSRNTSSYAKFPKELTEFTGSDFDIDTDFIEIRPEEGSKDEYIDDQIFDLQMASLKSSGSLQETFKPGDFKDLSRLSYYVTCLKSGKYTSAQLDKMDFDSLKKACEEIENMDLMNPVTDIVLHNQNSDASDMIAIAAVGVTSHAFISLYNDTDNEQKDPTKHPENFTRLSISKGGKGKVCEGFSVINDMNGAENATTKEIKGDVFLDMVYDMDGKLISSEISKYVGASADAAKDAALYRLNITTNTINVLLLMHRLGISSDVARLFIAQPVVQNVLRKLTTSSKIFGTSSIDNACQMVMSEILAQNGLQDSVWSDVKKDTEKRLVYSELKKNIEHPEEQTAYSQLQILYMFNTLASAAQSVKNLDSFTRYNSPNAMRGSSFIDRYVRRMKLDTLRKNLKGENARIKLPENIEPDPEIDDVNLGRLCSMFPYIGKSIFGENDMIENILLDNMKTYSYVFFEAIKRITAGYTNISDTELANTIKTIYTAYKNYLLFLGPNRIADFNNKETALYYTKLFPEKYSNMLERAKENKKLAEILEQNTFIQSIGFREMTKDRYDSFMYLDTDIANKTKEEMEKYKADWADLLNYPETRKLAIDCAIYFLARGSSYKRDTPVTVMPNAIKKAIPNYIEVFTQADKVSWDETDFLSFIAAVQRNNPGNRNLVPYFPKDPKYASAIIPSKITPENEEEKKKYRNAYLLTFNQKSREANARHIDSSKISTGLTFRLPVLNIGGELYLVNPADVLHKTGEGKNSSYSIVAFKVSELGIPNIMMEYTGSFSFDNPSLFTEHPGMSDEEFEQAKKDKKIPEEESLSANEEEPKDLEWNDSHNFEKGTRTGTYLEDTPFPDSEVSVEYDEALAKNTRDHVNNPYLESRTYLRRMEKIVSTSGIEVASINRGYNTIGGESKAGNAEYIINTSIPRKAKMSLSLHQKSVEAAAVMLTLGNGNYSTVKTYVESPKDANSIEVTIPLSGNFNQGKFSKFIDDLDVAFTVNPDSGEMSLLLSIDGTDVRGSLKKVSKEFGSVIRLFNFLKSKGLTNSDKIEVNYCKVDYITKGSERTKEILEDINPSEENETDTEQSGATGEDNGENNVNVAGKQSREARNKAWYNNIVELARRKVKGEDVTEEIADAFGDRRNNIPSTVISHTSKVLSDTVVRDMNTDVYEVMRQVASEKSENRSQDQVVDDIIINIANWIKNENPSDVLQTIMTSTGFSEEQSKDIITEIKNKLNELDIC